MPIFGQRDGRFTSHYSLTYIEAAQLVDDVPRLTRGAARGIDMLMQLAEELSFEMTLEPGDIQLLNNHVIYHGRTPFEDDAGSGHDRLLLRLWLAHAQQPRAAGGPRRAVARRAAGAVRGGIAQVAT